MGGRAAASRLRGRHLSGFVGARVRGPAVCSHFPPQSFAKTTRGKIQKAKARFFHAPAIHRQPTERTHTIFYFSMDTEGLRVKVL